MKLNIDVIERGLQSLKELQNVNLLGVVDHLTDGSYRLKPNIFPNSGAVYVFWWTGSLKRLWLKMQIELLALKGQMEGKSK